MLGETDPGQALVRYECARHRTHRLVTVFRAFLRIKLAEGCRLVAPNEDFVGDGESHLEGFLCDRRDFGI